MITLSQTSSDLFFTKPHESSERVGNLSKITQPVNGTKFSQLHGLGWNPPSSPAEAHQEHRPVPDHGQELPSRKGRSLASKGPQVTFKLL